MIVQWSNYENLKKWQQSNDFKQMVKESEEFTVSLKNFMKRQEWKFGLIGQRIQSVW